jgi:hypothetical protein
MMSNNLPTKNNDFKNEKNSILSTTHKKKSIFSFEAVNDKSFQTVVGDDYYDLFSNNLCYFDFNDPSNENILKILNKTKKKLNSTIDENYFRLKKNDFSVAFEYDNSNLTNFLKFKENFRMKLLKLRNLKPFLFSNKIPLNEETIKNDIELQKILSKEKKTLGFLSLNELLNDDNKTKFESKKFKNLKYDINNKNNNDNNNNDYSNEVVDDDDENDDDDLLKKRQLLGLESINVSKIKNFLEKIRNAQISIKNGKTKKIYFSTTVVREMNFNKDEEEMIPFIFNIFEKKRSLKPKIKKNKFGTTLKVENCHLLVQIIGAKNIPLRMDFANLSNISNNKLLSSNNNANRKDNSKNKLAKINDKKSKKKRNIINNNNNDDKNNNDNSDDNEDNENSFLNDENEKNRIIKKNIINNDNDEDELPNVFISQ